MVATSQAETSASTAARSTAERPHRRHMPPFPAFEAPASYEAYAAGETEGVYARQSGQAVAGSAGKEADDGGRSAGENAAEGQAPTMEEQVDAVVTCVCSQSALREVLYKTLVHCVEPRDFSEAEDFIAAQDEFVHSHIIQTPFTLVQMLVRAGGLEQTPLDEAGDPIDDARFDGLTDDEADDLVATYRLSTTEAGRQAAELLSPDRRLQAQIWQKPHRAETFYAVLDFCRTPRKFPEIQEYFKSNPGLVLDKVQANHTLSPDFYVDRLEKAGGLVWRGEWVTTEAGVRALAAHGGCPSSK